MHRGRSGDAIHESGGGAHDVRDGVRRTSYCVPAGPRLTRVLVQPLREDRAVAGARPNAPHATPFTAKPVVACIRGLLFIPRNTFGRLSPSLLAMQCRMASSKCVAVHGLAFPVKDWRK